MKYIDAERLKAEIKRIKNDYNRDSFVSGLAYLGKEEAIDEFCSLIDSLQQEQPEVDFEKEIEEHAIYMPHGEFASDNEIIEDMEWARKEFRHFYELGRQAKPEVFDTVAFQKGVQEGRRLEREEMPKWRNYGPNIIKDPFITDLGSLVVGEKCIRIYELYNLPGFKND